MSIKKGLKLKKVIDQKMPVTARQFLIIRVFALAIRILMETFAVTGCIVSSAMAMELEFDIWIFVLLSFGACVLMEVLSYLKKRWKLVYPVAGVLFLGVVFFLRSGLKNSLIVLWNTIAEHFCAYYGKPYIAVPAQLPQSLLEMTLLLGMFAVILDMVVLYVVKENGLRIFYLLATLPIVLYPYLFGLSVKGTGLLFYTGATISIVGGRVLRHFNGKRLRIKNFTEISVQGIILLVFFAVAMLTPFVFDQKDYEEKFDAKQIKNSIQDAMKDFETDLFDLFGAGDSSASYAGGLNNGKLGWVDEVNYTNKEALVVTLPGKMKNLNNKTLYLRGYIGDVYTKNQMETLLREDRKEYDELENKYDTSLDNISQKFMSSGILEEDVAEAFSRVEMFVVNWKKTGNLMGDIRKILFSDRFDVLSEKEAQKALTVRNVWTNEDDYFIPYFSKQPMERGHGGDISLSEGMEEAEIEGDTAYEMDFYYPAYSSLYHQLQGTENENRYTFGIITLREAFFLKKAMENYTGKTLEEYLASGQDSMILVSDLIRAMGKEPVVSIAHPEEKSVSLQKLAKTVQNLTNLLNLENEYRAWVRKTYLTLPKDSAEKMFEDMKKHEVKNFFVEKNGGDYGSLGEIGGISERQLAYAIRYVRKYIGKDTQYSLKPGSLPDGKDFVKYFLEESEQGYCIHYAAAGMLAFRAMGIPARYVEGFTIADENYEDAVENEDGTISVSLKDINAHAWVEIYLDGFGWYPVEMTPGFYADDEGEAKALGRQFDKENEPEDPGEEEEPAEEPEESENPESGEHDLASFQEEVTPPPGMMEWAEEEYKNQPDIKEPEKDKEFPFWLRLLLWILAGLFLLALIVFIQQKLVYGRMRKAFHDKDRNKRIVAAYLMFEKMLLHTLGKQIKAKNMEEHSVMELLSEVKPDTKKKKVLPAENIRKEAEVLNRLALMAYFSDREATEEEWKEALHGYRRIKMLLYRNVGFLEKIYFRMHGF